MRGLMLFLRVTYDKVVSSTSKTAFQGEVMYLGVVCRSTRNLHTWKLMFIPKRSNW